MKLIPSMYDTVLQYHTFHVPSIKVRSRYHFKHLTPFHGIQQDLLLIMTDTLHTAVERNLKKLE